MDKVLKTKDIGENAYEINVVLKDLDELNLYKTER
jgi:hypothetical protein